MTGQTSLTEVVHSGDTQPEEEDFGVELPGGQTREEKSHANNEDSNLMQNVLTTEQTSKDLGTERIGLTQSIEIERKAVDRHFWLSMELRLDDISVQNQSFTIEGWINVWWIWKQSTNSVPVYTYQSALEILIDHGNNLRDIDKPGLRLALKSLPIHPYQIFHAESITVLKFVEPARFHVYGLDENDNLLVRTEYHINAQLLEHLELFFWPFDRQFLNLKLVFYDDKNAFKNYVIRHDKRGKYLPQLDEMASKVEKYWKNPLICTLRESLADELTMNNQAWFDFRCRDTKDTEDTKDTKKCLEFSLVRLRIQRKFANEYLTIIVPFFLIVCTSFTVFYIDYYNIGNRLEVAVTILLTFAAFQDLIRDKLPKTEDILLINLFVFLSYLVVVGIVIETCFLYSKIDKVSDLELHAIDDTAFYAMGIAWCSISLLYFLLPGIFKIKCVDEWIWENYSERELASWKKQMERKDVKKSKNLYKYEESCKTMLFDNIYCSEEEKDDKINTEEDLSNSLDKEKK